jgi:hypothetical protein
MSQLLMWSFTFNILRSLIFKSTITRDIERYHRPDGVSREVGYLDRAVRNKPNQLRHRHFIIGTFWHVHVLALRTYRHMDILSPWMFQHKDFLARGHFGTRNFGSMDVSARDISSP